MYQKLKIDGLVFYITPCKTEVWLVNGSEGLGGATKTFKLEDGTIETVVGPNLSTTWFLEQVLLMR